MAGVSISQTRIPDYPDQGGFLERWYEFHQGYRVTTDAAGAEHRVAVSGEPLTDVSPGHLPRTLDELRTRARYGHEEHPSTIQAHSYEAVAVDVRSLDDTIDQLMEDVAAEEEQHDRHEAVASHSAELPAVSAVTDPFNSASAAIRQPSGNPSSGPRSEAALARLARVWGSREEIQSTEYISPIAGMFNRAWGRYRNLEELRTAQEHTDVERMEAALRNIERDPAAAWYATPQAQAVLADSLGFRGDGTSSAINTEARLAAMERTVGLLAQIRGQITQMERPSRSSTAPQDPEKEEKQYLGLDGDGRPPPREEHELLVKLECKVCLSQLANVACLPCGHLGLCTWCADQLLPVLEHDKTRLREKCARCPMCRKRIKRRVQVFTP